MGLFFSLKIGPVFGLILGRVRAPKQAPKWLQHRPEKLPDVFGNAGSNFEVQKRSDSESMKFLENWFLDRFL